MRPVPLRPDASPGERALWHEAFTTDDGRPAPPRLAVAEHDGTSTPWWVIVVDAALVLVACAVILAILWLSA